MADNYCNVINKETAEDFCNRINNGMWLVLYHAVWCGHCISMKPEWEKLVAELKKTKKCNVADVESSCTGFLTYKPKTYGFPTLILYNNGVNNDINNQITYDGGRTCNDILAFVDKHAKNNTSKRSTNKTGKNKRKSRSRSKRSKTRKTRKSSKTHKTQ